MVHLCVFFTFGFGGNPFLILKVAVDSIYNKKQKKTLNKIVYLMQKILLLYLASQFLFLVLYNLFFSPL